METILTKIFLYIVVVLSAVIHEYSHGLMAYRLGDSTAKYAGRLTLNPFVHLEMFGTVLLPLFLLFTSGMFIGWAKPVPYNPYNLSDQKYGSLKVAVAGPGSNLLIALILGLILRFFSSALTAIPFITPLSLQFIGLIVYINIILALFNLIPIPPLDGSKIIADLFPNSRYLEQAGIFGIFMALLVAFFILSPIAQLVFSLITGSAFGL